MEVKQFQIVKPRNRLRRAWDRVICFEVIAVMWVISGTLHLVTSDFIWGGGCFAALLACCFIERWRLKKEVEYKQLLEDINKEFNAQLRKVAPWKFN